MRVALFDVCHTLVGVTTVRDFTERVLLSPQRNSGFKPAKRLLRFSYRVLGKLRLIDAETYRSHFWKLFKGYSEPEIHSLAEKYWAARLAGVSKPVVFKRLGGLKHDGYRVILVSAGLDAYLRPLAKLLGAELVSTSLAKDRRGIYTGGIDGIECVGEKKVEKLRRELPYFDEIDWPASAAFSDSASDIPMLSLVGKAAVVDPDEHLEAYAREKGWEVIKTQKMPSPRHIEE